MPALVHARSRIALLFVVAASLLSGCVPPAASDPYRAAPSGAQSLTVEIYNDHVMDMRVYLVRGDTPIPLGSVGSAERRVFRISSAELGHSGYIRLMADPLGSRDTYTSDVIQVAAGQRVEWRLAHALALSSVTVRW